MIVVDLGRIWSSIHHDHEKQGYFDGVIATAGVGGADGTSGRISYLAAPDSPTGAATLPTLRCAHHAHTGD
jgi:hypothetical protein